MKSWALWDYSGSWVIHSGGFCSVIAGGFQFSSLPSRFPHMPLCKFFPALPRPVLLPHYSRFHSVEDAPVNGILKCVPERLRVDVLQQWLRKAKNTDPDDLKRNHKTAMASVPGNANGQGHPIPFGLFPYVSHLLQVMHAEGRGVSFLPRLPASLTRKPLK